MTPIDVIDVYTSLENLGIEIWVDGGWGVDALLGEQTRPHKDLDIAIQQKDVPKLRELLEARGYKDIKLEEAQPWNFVLGDDKDHEIDVHVIVFDDNRNGLYGPVEKGIMYPAASLTGSGAIDGHTVKWVVLENNNEHLKQRSAEGLPLFRALLSSRQEVVLVSCLWVGPGAPGSAGVQSVRPSAW